MLNKIWKESKMSDFSDGFGIPPHRPFQFFRGWVISFYRAALLAACAALPWILYIIGTFPEGSRWYEFMVVTTRLAFVGSLYAGALIPLRRVAGEKPEDFTDWMIAIATSVIFFAVAFSLGIWLWLRTGSLLVPMVKFSFALIPLLALAFTIILFAFSKQDES